MGSVTGEVLAPQQNKIGYVIKANDKNLKFNKRGVRHYHETQKIAFLRLKFFRFYPRQWIFQQLYQTEIVAKLMESTYIISFK